MDSRSEKCVLVINGELPAGEAANIAAILGITLGKELPEVVGGGVRDGQGRTHLGIIAFPVPVLKSPAEGLRRLRETLYDPEFQNLTVVDFPDLAQSCRTYEEFTGRMETAERPSYLGVAICGERKKINRLTGSMPLLR